VAEVKKGNFLITITENGKEKDALIVKVADAKFAPTNCKLTSFYGEQNQIILTDLDRNDTNQDQ
jgi:hypothetical protein